MNGKNRKFDFVPPVSLKDENGKKNNIVEVSVVNTGALVAYIIKYSACKIAYSVKHGTEKARKTLRLSVMKNAAKAKEKMLLTVAGVACAAKSFVEFNARFVSNVKKDGFSSAVKTQCREILNSVKENKAVFGSFVNYAVPVASVALLVGIVYNTASTSYGIAVECNGKEIGVVAAESVVNEAQKAIADRSVYYDTADEIFVTANLSIKPLNAHDEVMDENTLADVMEEELTGTVTVAELAADAAEGAAVVQTLASYDGAVTETDVAGETGDEFVPDGKVRAYPVTVDGEVIGYVDETDELAEFLEEEKSKYTEEGVVDVDFDKELEYDYEQYVQESELVEQQEIIDTLTSIVAEPVYYEIQNGDSPWNIARDNDMSLDELKNCITTFDGRQIEDITEECPVGAVVQISAEVPYLQVKVTKDETYIDIIDYEIIKTEDPNLYKGETVVDVQGVEGEAEVNALVTYENGVPVSREILSQTVLSAPVAKEVRVGTRETTTEVSTGSGGSGEYFWPVDGGYISDYYGGWRNHKGLDIAAPYGTKIYAAESGTVTSAGNKYNGYGNCVIVSHNDGNVTLYAHMSSIAINYGDYVVKGQLLGYVGSTGNSTGNHLHFEVRTNGYYNDPLDYVSQY